MAVDLGLNGPQVRTHAGHSHHHHDNTYLTSRNKSDPGVRITRIGLYVNLGMALAKGTGGILFNSQALTADALHAMTDLVSDITTLATISYSLKPPTSRFPLGFGKVESLGALGVSGLLLSGGIMIGLQAIMALCQQFFPEVGSFLSSLGIFEHGHHHGHAGVESVGPDINAAWLAGGSIVIKEWLYRATIKVARQKRSSVLASNAYHHRIDSLTSFVALLVIAMSNFIRNAQWLDPVGGLIISGMIVQAGWVNTRAAVLELTDVAMDNDIQQSVQSAANAALGQYAEDELKLQGVQGIKSGQNFLVELEVAAPSYLTTGRAQEIEEAVRQQVSARVRGVRRVLVRFTDKAADAPAFADEFVAGRLSDSEDEEHAHDHDEHNHAKDAFQSSGNGKHTEANGNVRKRR
ncbi:hypothetical protein BAUCODRAFT_73281 [Baudoinia panamericana UAMH 10762]|uniref:Cation efflux protein transmembrane domain-containing protein n=1 Tax=Baudoinia panamericana (strain UAMH 10762) TaxID=717646 RepID=M2N5S4_BAUPA|nr:uncharacterized protein BAUCODRAFT_73281 [Baudoinia panamericana UAMH 10762]EMC94389.1 hypothetical protein BAUCODRAFT_73281 [Baudoinia panamericana UAMH 10762]